MFEVNEVALELGRLFKDAGFELALVGGSVRDVILQRESDDLDFTTNAEPEQTLRVLRPFVDDIWDIGKKFGTIGGNKTANGETVKIEITTYRTDEYDPESRKPLVKYGKTIESDLSRRDFTVNSIALRLPELELVDPFNGISDIAQQILRTPIEPEKSFDDDPLRMMRAVRFISTLGFSIETETASAILKMANRLEIVSKERIRDEFCKLLMGDDPARGIEEMIGFGLNDFVIPELEELKMEIDPAHHHKDVYDHSLKVLQNAISLEEKYLGGKDLTMRLTALLHDIGKPVTRKFESGNKVSFRLHDVVGAKIAKSRLQTLKFDKQTISSVEKLIELHMRFYGYGDVKWTDSAVRRYVVDAGDELARLHVLTRSDVTTKNANKANRLANAYDDIEERIVKIKEQEQFEKIRPDLDGNEIKTLLNIDQDNPKERWKIGKAYKYMLSYRIENGPVSKEQAAEILLHWAKENLP
ncbi:MAG: CCA tRNA nucleotidyltransferase [Candidatus Ancillula sp.]|jgi:poly(A) polymerase|nr:CCA tRNA nucleotidyltransferase [Candidatus Ancillula sp.]